VATPAPSIFSQGVQAYVVQFPPRTISLARDAECSAVFAYHGVSDSGTLSSAYYGGVLMTRVARRVWSGGSELWFLDDLSACVGDDLLAYHQFAGNSGVVWAGVLKGVGQVKMAMSAMSGPDEVGPNPLATVTLALDPGSDVNGAREGLFLGGAYGNHRNEGSQTAALGAFQPHPSHRYHDAGYKVVVGASSLEFIAGGSEDVYSVGAVFYSDPPILDVLAEPIAAFASLSDTLTVDDGIRNIAMTPIEGVGDLPALIPSPTVLVPSAPPSIPAVGGMPNPLLEAGQGVSPTAIPAVGGMPKPSVSRGTLFRTINLIGGGISTPERLDDSLEVTMAVPFVGRTADGSAPGKPVWKDLEDYAMSGPTGPEGPAGPTGPQGDPGTPGATGAQGVPGQASLWLSGAGAPDNGLGEDGDFYLDTVSDEWYFKAAGVWSLQGDFTGAVGPQGPQGIPGDTGATGAQGDPGIQGVPGNDGAPGVDGDDGAPGAPGAPGADGVDGSTWYSGTGAPGAGLGVNGDFYLDDATGNVYAKAAGAWSVVDNLTGPQGTQGIQGVQGDPGSQGIQGVPGDTGAQGIQGVPGNDGNDGAPGAPGTDGTDGSTWHSGTGAPAGGLGVNGDFYLDDANGDVYVKAAGVWGLADNLTGPQGTQGIQGIQGVQGDPGADGADGATGPPGTTLHSGLSDVTTDQHHAKSHIHDGADGSGTIAHSALSGVTANQHHAQAHDLIDSVNHPVSAITPGHILTALTTSTYGFVPAAAVLGDHEHSITGDGGDNLEPRRVHIHMQWHLGGSEGETDASLDEDGLLTLPDDVMFIRFGLTG
jgi:hypothetical protein